MSVRARLSPRAQRDLDSIRSHIATENPEAANRVYDAVLATADFLAQNPGLGHRIRNATVRHAETHWFVVTGFRNYLIFYQPFHDTIMVLRVLHAAQDWTRFFPRSTVRF
jgi:toxin ParE1/3/4